MPISLLRLLLSEMNSLEVLSRHPSACLVRSNLSAFVRGSATVEAIQETAKGKRHVGS